MIPKERIRCLGQRMGGLTKPIVERFGELGFCCTVRKADSVLGDQEKIKSRSGPYGAINVSQREQFG